MLVSEKFALVMRSRRKAPDGTFKPRLSTRTLKADPISQFHMIELLVTDYQQEESQAQSNREQ
eukprot:4184353-Amphidinium_carterae.1